MSAGGHNAAVEMRGIVKRFGAVKALDGARFTACAGQITALVGENGAGKTTLMRILAGRLRANAGEIRIDGRAADLASPREAARHGVAMVEQGCRLIGGLSIFENIILGAKRAAGRRERRSKAARVAETMGLAAELEAKAETLGAPQRQRAAIARALYGEPQVVILDEPTSLGGAGEREALFGVMRRLAGEGAAVIFSSHKLGEVFEVADEITVLRRGKTVLVRAKDETSPGETAVAMVGAQAAQKAPERGAAGDTAVKLEGVTTGGEGRGALAGVSLELRSGEVVGIAGVAGNGQEALAEVVAGLAEPARGKVERACGAARTGILSDDADAADVILGMRVWENAILGREGEFARWWGIDGRAAREKARALSGEFGIETEEDAAAGALSGGNRQRLAIARELADGPRLIVAHEPTRGLDIRSAAFARERLRGAAAGGAAVLVISYDLDELYAVADRIVVMSSGQIFEPGKQPPDRSELGALMAQR